ncbi:MAG TPA: exodeoxyribonuclease VII small subunit [Anaerolineales bacterium]|nr:exodeoxyribonuclease VII small subunit [Anaerolineales bacterium]
MPKAKSKPPEELTFEQAFEELQEVVAALESGDLPLEDSLRLFERGQALAERCSQLLEHAELRLKQLVPDDRGGYREEDLEVEE